MTADPVKETRILEIAVIERDGTPTMRYELRLIAYDMLDQVHIVGILEETDQGFDGPTERRLRWTATVQGTGKSTPAAWTTDTLIAALEALP